LVLSQLKKIFRRQSRFLRLFMSRYEEEFTSAEIDSSIAMVASANR
jgi:hypothetical protein